jgi:hypothetical protein
MNTIERIVDQLESQAREIADLKSKIDQLDILPEFIPVSVAAQILNRSEDGVRRLLKSGAIEGRLNGSVYLAKTDSVRSYRVMNPGARTSKKLISAVRNQRVTF